MNCREGYHRISEGTAHYTKTRQISVGSIMLQRLTKPDIMPFARQIYTTENWISACIEVTSDYLVTIFPCKLRFGELECSNNDLLRLITVILDLSGLLNRPERSESI